MARLRVVAGPILKQTNTSSFARYLKSTSSVHVGGWQPGASACPPPRAAWAVHFSCMAVQALRALLSKTRMTSNQIGAV